MTLKAFGISSRSAERWLLRDVSFEFAPGQILGVFGDGDSGRTALLDVLSGVRKADAGEIWLDEEELLRSGALSKIANSFDGRPRAEKGGWLARIFGKDPPSYPHRPDVNADITSTDSSIVVLDAPFSHLTLAERQAELLRLKGIILAKRKYCIFTSVDFDDLMLACDSIVVLSNGDVAQIGTPEEVYCRPATREVARLTGRSNIFEARRLTSSKADVPEFQTIEGSHRIVTERFDKRILGPLNQNVFLAIRPEHISISFGASFPEDNVVRAVVEKVDFLGPITLVQCNAGELRLVVTVARLVGLNIGEECLLSLPPDRVRVFTK